MILTAKTKKGKAFYEKAVRILPDIPDAPASDDAEGQNAKPVGFTPETVKAKLRHFVQQERLGKYDTVVVLGRDDVEVRSMLFPPVPNEEIPDMASFQAPKEFTEYDPSAALDFVLFDGARKDKKHILASVLTKSKRETIEDIVSGAGLDLQRIVLGPCESAKRFATITVQQRTGGAGKTTLLVEMGELSATLVLLYRGQPAFVRTAHFQKPVWAELEKADQKRFDDPAELANWKWLTAEFKRTIVAAINDVPSDKIDEVVLCGAGERYEKLVRLLEESLAVPVSLFNVWRFENREGEIKNHLPAFEEQFLPLLGALTAALAEKPNALDFKNPKRRPEKHSNRTLITGIVAACVLLVLASGAWGFHRRSTIEKEWKQVLNEKQQLETLTANYQQVKDQSDSINAWKKGNINWLEQLEWLSTNMPQSQDVIVSGDLSLSAPAKADPTLKFTANTRGTAIVKQLEDNLRDDTHRVISPTVTPSQNRTYTHTADITVRVTPTFPASNVPARPAAAAAATDTASDAATPTAAASSPAPETGTPQPPQQGAGPQGMGPQDRQQQRGGREGRWGGEGDAAGADNRRGPQGGPQGWQQGEPQGGPQQGGPQQRGSQNEPPRGPQGQEGPPPRGEIPPAPAAVDAETPVAPPTPPPAGPPDVVPDAVSDDDEDAVADVEVDIVDVDIATDETDLPPGTLPVEVEEIDIENIDAADIDAVDIDVEDSDAEEIDVDDVEFVDVETEDAEEQDADGNGGEQ